MIEFEMKKKCAAQWDVPPTGEGTAAQITEKLGKIERIRARLRLAKEELADLHEKQTEASVKCEWDSRLGALHIQWAGFPNGYMLIDHERYLPDHLQLPEIIAEIRKHRPLEAHETRHLNYPDVIGAMSIDGDELVLKFDGIEPFRTTREYLVKYHTDKPERLAYFDANYVPPLEAHEFVPVYAPEKRGRFVIAGDWVAARYGDELKEQQLCFQDIKEGIHRHRNDPFTPNAERMVAWCRTQPEYIAWLKEQEAPLKLERGAGLALASKSPTTHNAKRSARG